MFNRYKLFNQNKICFPDDTETCYKMLYSALNGIHGLTVNQSFDVDIREITYELNSSSPQAFSSVQCSNGMVPIRYYCGM